ncbi:MAG: tyrosine-type recombinase/integrase [Patescibacteria group bacterium]|nr:tyrosine-type recombinase/integrase [Patescibacteria group bacterium]
METEKQLVTLDDALIRSVFRSVDVSEKTRRDYERWIDSFISHCRNGELGYDTLIEFKRSLAESESSVSTKNKKLSVARIFLKELTRRRMIPPEIVQQDIKAFRQSKRHKVPGVTLEEVEQIEESLLALPDSTRTRRTAAMFELLARQGLRQIEVRRLDLDDVDVEGGTTFVLGKGRDDKEKIFLLPRTALALKRYARLRGNESGPFFLTLSDRPSDRITTMTINREMKALFEKAGVSKTVHGLRHFYVTALLKRFSPTDVQKFSRHRSIEMVQVYNDEMNLEERAGEVSEYLDSMFTSPKYQTYIDEGEGRRMVGHEIRKCAVESSTTALIR